MRRYVFVRTDKRRQEFIRRELEQGRLRQGWGSLPEDDLRAMRRRVDAGERLSERESAVWRNRRLLDTEADGLKLGDIVIVPNVPEQGKWTLARVAGPYSYETPTVEAGVGTDYAHVVRVDAIRRLDGTIGVVEADNIHVDARLRASTRSMSRMWSVDSLAASVERLVATIERGADTRAVLGEHEKVPHVLARAHQSTWDAIRDLYRAEELEHLVHHVLERLYVGGRVEHWGGAGEKGADLIVFTRDPLGLEFKIAVQVKMHHGVDDDLHSLAQIRTARAHHHVDAGIVVTTADEVSERFEIARAALEAELLIDIRVLTRADLVDLVLRHADLAGSSVSR